MRVYGGVESLFLARRLPIACHATVLRRGRPGLFNEMWFLLKSSIVGKSCGPKQHSKCRQIRLQPACVFVCMCACSCARARARASVSGRRLSSLLLKSCSGRSFACFAFFALGLCFLLLRHLGPACTGGASLARARTARHGAPRRESIVIK